MTVPAGHIFRGFQEGTHFSACSFAALYTKTGSIFPFVFSSHNPDSCHSISLSNIELVNWGIEGPTIFDAIISIPSFTTSCFFPRNIRGKEAEDGSRDSSVLTYKKHMEATKQTHRNAACMGKQFATDC